jgi:hypothetical protein
MNTSYSKIRHIRESNILLESRRIISEQKNFKNIASEVRSVLGYQTDIKKLMSILQTNITTKQELSSLQQVYGQVYGDDYVLDVNNAIKDTTVSNQYNIWINTLK